MVFGDRVAGRGYKNALHSFRGISQLLDLATSNQAQSENFEIVCLGGDPQLEPELATLIGNIKVHQLSLSDRDLQAAYTGAVALIYPSRYEGFGLPILEAMACGCPVITCRNSALPEVAGDAALYVSETDVAELIIALQQVQQPEIRSRLIAAGLLRVQHFSWTKMADIIAQVLIDTQTEIQSGKLRPLLNLPLVKFRQSTATQIKLDLAYAQIASMESSKFWQLRQIWFQLKKWLRLGDDSQ